ncbi:MAG TPA: hypothetical protein VF717_09280 [Pyrinomonadaceae bacterium]|jgi:hypothetical protein
MSRRSKKLVLINLRRPGTYTFDLDEGDVGLPFPASIRTSDRNNWEMADTIGGVKPPQYANREPQKISFDECWLTTVGTNLSLTEAIEHIRALMNQRDNGTPPPLLMICGDWQVRCTLEELDIDRDAFTPENNQQRAKVSMTLFELPELREQVNSRIVEIDEGEAESFSPIGNF